MTLSTSVAGALAIAFAGALVGAGAAFLFFGGFSAFTFLVMAVLLFMLILYLQVAMNCVVHGCTPAEQSITGYLESQSRAGGTTWSFEVSGAKAGATACVLALAFSPLLVATPVAQGCGAPDPKCAASAMLDWAVDEAIELYIDVADPLGGATISSFARKSPHSSCENDPDDTPRTNCSKALKLFKEIERLLSKNNKKLGEAQKARLKELYESGQLKGTDLPGNLKREFPGEFLDWTLSEVRAHCK